MRRISTSIWQCEFAKLLRTKKKKSKDTEIIKDTCNKVKYCILRFSKIKSFLKKFKIEWPYHLAIPLQGIYLKKMQTLTQKDVCNTLMFMQHYLHVEITINNEWIKKMLYVHNRVLFAHKKRGRNLSFETLDEHGGHMLSKSDKERQILLCFSFIWGNLKTKKLKKPRS